MFFFQLDLSSWLCLYKMHLCLSYVSRCIDFPSY
uniref:Uncharacterized protein n=1 Tax=Anguilla anguilla TaxID=7936 RepID=A0A0E9T233_ANGAN